MYNFAAVIESRFLYNLRAFSSTAEGGEATYILDGQNVKITSGSITLAGGREENAERRTELDGYSYLQQTRNDN